METNEGIGVRDLVHYSLPFGPLGRLTHALMIQARLKEIFDYRWVQSGLNLDRSTNSKKKGKDIYK